MNLLMVSIVYQRWEIPIYFRLLPFKGYSNLAAQKSVLEPALAIFNEFKVVVLGEREFCSVDLAKWLSKEAQVYLSLRLRKNEYIKLEEQIWFQVKQLKLAPATALFYEGVRVTKTKGFGNFNLATKYCRNYR